VFIVIEGPNGVGKSTISQILADRLSESRPTFLTTEPTGTILGQLLRSAESSLRGRRYALAFAADRYGHIEDDIAPRLSSGVTVISDRYVQSSLVLQRIDGLALKEVWSYNRFVLKPDLSVYLDNDPAVTGVRLRARGQLSRLEEQGSPEREVELYRQARVLLAGMGWRQSVVDCRGRSPEEITASIVADLPEADGPQAW
jgi:dTMP kinase